MLAPPSLPTPLVRAADLDTPGAELLVKNDGLSHPLYGGNKVRKAVDLVAAARARGARRILTFGAAGSHHVLTMTLFARAAGLGCAAILVPQPVTPHVADTLRASLGAGLEPYPVRHASLVPLAAARALRRGDHLVPPGGSNVTGSRSYVRAVAELRRQLDEGGIAPPDWIVVAVGSGGTCAGITAGVIQQRLPCRVLGVQVVPGPAAAWLTRRLTRALLRRLGLPSRHLDDTLRFDASQVGAGYGYLTKAGDRATARARAVGLTLDPTYTAKAFAGALDLLQSAPPSGRRSRVLYWHTLSATPISPLLAQAPPLDALPASVRRLLSRADLWKAQANAE
jgi:D-cysteine desulfhydrase